jgi:hypothetical protein
MRNKNVKEKIRDKQDIAKSLGLKRTADDRVAVWSAYTQTDQEVSMVDGDIRAVSQHARHDMRAALVGYGLRSVGGEVIDNDGLFLRRCGGYCTLPS